MRRLKLIAGALLIAAGAHAAEPPAPKLPHLNDLAAAFGSRPQGGGAALSPSGDAVVMMMPMPGVHSIAVVRDVATGKITPLLSDDKSEFRLRGCAWKTEQRLICFLSANGKITGLLVGAGRVIAIDRDATHVVLLGRKPAQIGFTQNSGEIVDLLPDDPKSILMAMAAPANRGSGVGVYAIDVGTNAFRQVESPREDAGGFESDAHGHVRAMTLYRSDSNGNIEHSARTMVRPTVGAPWREFITFDPLDRDHPRMIGFDESGTHALVLKMKDGRRALFRTALDGSGGDELVLANDKVDVDGVLRIGKYRRPVAAEYTLDDLRYAFFDPRLEKLDHALAKAIAGNLRVSIGDESWDGKRMLVYAGADEDPGVLYRYDSTTHQLATLFDVQPALAGRKLGAVSAIAYPAADGSMVPAYLTLPPGHADMRGLPAMLMPHGGPSARDTRGFDWLSQFWAASGYAVLRPNYRGSSGYGDKWFVDNGFKSWKLAMGDINDGAAWMLKQGADAARLVIFGWSYGGYAALQANVLDPHLYKAAVAVAPVTDLGMLRSKALDYGNARVERDFIGSGPHVVEGSPAKNADKIAVPVLLFQGTLDLNVDPSQAHRMDAALTSAHKKHELVIYPGLDHQLDDADARADMLRRSAAFFAANLGGAR